MSVTDLLLAAPIGIGIACVLILICAVALDLIGDVWRWITGGWTDPEPPSWERDDA